MKFKNFEREKKEDICFNSGDIILFYDETICGDVICMIVEHDSKYNLLNLNTAVLHFYYFSYYDDLQRILNNLFSSVEVIKSKDVQLSKIKKGE